MVLLFLISADYQEAKLKVFPPNPLILLKTPNL